MLLRRSLAFSLEQAGYQVTVAADAEAGLALLDGLSPHLLLLDMGLPGMDGLDALRQIRRRGDVPVIFVTARRRELEQVLGLELGADDYVTKPFDVEVLLARIKAVLRRYRRHDESTHSSSALVAGDLIVDPATHLVHAGDRQLELGRREFDLLYALVEMPGHVLSTEDLLERVWGSEFLGESQVVYVHVRRLREKIEEDPSDPQRILTVRGVGYKLIIQEP